MIRNLKVLGLAITAVLALVAVSGAASAQAVVPRFHCTASPRNTCSFTANEINTHTFNVQRGNVRCRSSLQGTIDETKVTHIAGVRATYTGCRAFGVAANVNMGTCTYTFEMTEDPNAHTGDVSVICEGGNILVEAASLPCTINVPSQETLRHVIFNNQGDEPTHVRANITIAGIRYTTSGVGCPGGSTGTFNDGTYNGESTIEGFIDEGPGRPHGTKVGFHVVTS